MVICVGGSMVLSLQTPIGYVQWIYRYYKFETLNAQCDSEVCLNNTKHFLTINYKKDWFSWR